MSSAVLPFPRRLQSVIGPGGRSPLSAGPALPALTLVFSLGTALIPSGANACEEMWYLRNLIADRAGYCFTTPLGEAIFDNGDCTTTELGLSPSESARFHAIRAVEEAYSCAVDVSKTTLPYLERRDWNLIETLPVPDGLESACQGYRFRPFALRSGPRGDAAVVGEVRTGDTVRFRYLDEGDWMFLITDGPSAALGWAPVAAMQVDDKTCAAYAG